MTGEKSTGATDPVIESRALTKEFRRGRSGRRGRTDSVLRAVDSLTVTIRPGEAVGYIGANGAGKSTTIKMITGILKPSTGSVLTCGLDPMRHRRDLARRIGVVFGQRSQLWWDLPLQESLRILGAIHALPPARWQRRRDQLVERLDLAAFLDRPVRRLSLGERMRGELAAALLHEPELLILDEPTVGLDVLSKERLRVFLREENQGADGGPPRTMLLTTHDMDDVQRLCPRLIVVDTGRCVYDGDHAGLVARVGANRLLVIDLVDPVQELAGALAGLPVAVERTDDAGLRHTITFAPGEVSAGAVLDRVSAVAAIHDLSLSEPDIEEVVRRLYASSA